MAIEIKATKAISKKHLKGLLALREEGQIEKYFIASNDPISREMDGVKILFWKDFLYQLWQKLP